MKVLVLAPHPLFVPRGTPIAVRAVLEGLSAQGHRVDVLSFHEGEDITDLAGVAHHRIDRPWGVDRVPIGVSWQKLVSDVWLYGRAKRMIRDAAAAGEPYDVIHAGEEAVFLAAWFGRRFGMPFVYDMDSRMSAQLVEKSPWLTPASWVFEWLEKKSIAASAGVLAVCPALVDEAKPMHPAGNVALLPDIPNTGTADGELPPALVEAPGPPEGVRFMYVGNLEPYQGVDLMLDAFKLAARESGEAELIVVGGTESKIEHYSTKARDLVTVGRVRFVGPVPIDRLGRVMEHADVLVSPRIKGDNTPMKVYSYLQSGKPVLATRLLTHTQVMDDRVSVLVEPTAEAMGKAMVELAESAQRRAEVGAAGRAYVEREFSRDAYRERLRRFYDGLEHEIKPKTGTAKGAAELKGGGPPLKRETA
ncbi:MAG: glycosyltransferase family 4 protein [Planctomycetota bacterium]